MNVAIAATPDGTPVKVVLDAVGVVTVPAVVVQEYCKSVTPDKGLWKPTKLKLPFSHLLSSRPAETPVGA